MRRDARGMSTFAVGVDRARRDRDRRVYFGFTKAIPFRDHYEVKAAFRRQQPAQADSPVRIAGVKSARSRRSSAARAATTGAS